MSSAVAPKAPSPSVARFSTLAAGRRHALHALAVIGTSAFLSRPRPSFAQRPPGESLPRIGPAPSFTLTDQDGRRVSSRTWRGKVTVVTFLFTGCSRTCPLLTAKLVSIQRSLGPAPEVQFIAITVDPLNDTPAVLKAYARAQGADPRRFAFLTGSPEEIDRVLRRYALYRSTGADGNVDHAFLTSIVDRTGILRVQYLGTRFDPNEFLADLRAVLAERPPG